MHLFGAIARSNAARFKLRPFDPTQQSAPFLLTVAQSSSPAPALLGRSFRLLSALAPFLLPEVLLSNKGPGPSSSFDLG